MMKNVRWRVGLTVAVIAMAIWAFYPPDQKINLGLDLKGGVHLVLKVQTDDAVRIETETTSERVRDALTRAGVQVTNIAVVPPRQFRVEGIQDEAAFRAWYDSPEYQEAVAIRLAATDSRSTLVHTV